MKRENWGSVLSIADKPTHCSTIVTVRDAHRIKLLNMRCILSYFSFFRGRLEQLARKKNTSLSPVFEQFANILLPVSHSLQCHTQRHRFYFHLLLFHCSKLLLFFFAVFALFQWI